MKNTKRTVGIIFLAGSYIVDILTFLLCTYLDTVVIPDTNVLGHPAPATLILWFILVGPFTIISNIIGIVLLATSTNNKTNYNGVAMTYEQYKMQKQSQNYQQQYNVPIQPIQYNGQTMCPSCGHTVKNSIYCGNCGFKL